MNNATRRRCGAMAVSESEVCWRVWAPRAKRVDLVLIHGDERRVLALSPEVDGYFVHSAADIREGQRYAYRLDGGPERPDPASRWQPDGVHRPSAVLRPEGFVWTDQAWQGICREALVFYELHVGAFTLEGTFDAVIRRLDALRELGVTALELMPIAQFPGPRNWGYDGVHPYAPQNSYGGPHGLQRLVDACHAAGLAVFLDVVYNHLGPEGNYLNEFGPYFTDRYRTPWGSAFNYDGAGCDPVRDFILNNVAFWIDVFHVDGLRLDAVHAIHDAGPRHILRAIKETADEVVNLEGRGRRVHVIAESNLNDVRLLRPPEVGGHGLDAQWNDDFHHAVHSYLTGERSGYLADFGDVRDFPKLFEKTFLLDGVTSRFHERRHGAPADDLPGDCFVVSIQNHDQVGNRAAGDRLSTLLSPPAQRLAASLMLLAPHLPLLFMGEEYGETRPFPFFCSFEDAQLIENVRQGRRREFADFEGEVPDPQAAATYGSAQMSWSWPEGSPQAGLRSLYRDLLRARRLWPALRDFQHRSARLHDSAVLELVRGADPRDTLRVIFNLTGMPQPLVEPSLPEHLLFCSEAKQYGGSRQQGEVLRELCPFECVAFGNMNWEEVL